MTNNQTAAIDEYGNIDGDMFRNPGNSNKFSKSQSRTFYNRYDNLGNGNNEISKWDSCNVTRTKKNFEENRKDIQRDCSSGKSQQGHWNGRREENNYKICKYFLLGRCWAGDNCRFLHNSVESDCETMGAYRDKGIEKNASVLQTEEDLQFPPKSVMYLDKSTNTEEAWHGVPDEIMQMFEEEKKERIIEIEDFKKEVNGLFKSVSVAFEDMLDIFKMEYSNIKEFDTGELNCVKKRISPEQSENEIGEYLVNVSNQMSTMKNLILNFHKPKEKTNAIESTQIKSMHNESAEYNDKSIKEKQSKSYKSALVETDVKISNDEPQNISCASKVPSTLTNTTSNCYQNSAIQCLSSSSLLIEHIRKLKNKYPNLKNLDSFHDVLISMTTEDNGKPIKLCSSSLFNKWKKIGQQDSFELISHIVNEVYNEIREEQEVKGSIEKGNMKEWLEQNLPLRLSLSFLFICDKCGSESWSPCQTDLALHLTIPNREITIQGLINHHFDKEIIDGSVCQNCHSQDMTKYTQLVQPFPDTLCIHLQRSHWSGYNMQKICGRVKFTSTVVYIKEHYFDALHRAKEIMKRREGPRMILGKSCDDIIYRLVSVIVHNGTANKGHYTCYRYVANTWYMTNDTNIWPVNPNEVLSCDPYIMLYEKRK